MKKRSPSRGRKPAMKEAKFQVGEKVKAKWPGSNLFFDAEILAVDAKARTVSYTVQFEGEYEDVVPESSIEKPRNFRSRSASKSPARKGRRRSRSRSPGRGRRKSSSPPTKQVELEKKVEDTPPSSPEATPRKRGRKPTKKVVETVMVTSPQAQHEVVQTKSESVQFVRMTRSQARKLAVQASTEEAELKDKTGENAYEYGGPVVMFLMIHVLPLLLYCLYLFCNEHACAVKQYPKLPLLRDFFDINTFLVLLEFVLFIASLSLLPIGKVVSGLPQANGTVKKYRMNGFFCLVMCLGAAGLGFHYKKISVNFVYDKFLPLMTSALIISLLFSIALYIKARLEKTDLAPDGNSDSALYNFCVGQQLNPQTFGIDLKFLCARIGVIGWILLNLCLAAKVYQRPGPFPVPIIMLGTFQFIQAVDFLWFEEYLLYYPTVYQEGLGFLTVMTLFAWIPFVNACQMRYLIDYPVFHTKWAIAGIVALQVLGYIIYRGSNSQKCRFKINPEDSEFTSSGVIETPTGRKLLASGCWGIVRHPNYLGDILIHLSIALTCGFGHAIPYFNLVFIVLMLLDRMNRYETSCAKKYGQAWEELCQRVPYKIIPKVF